MEYFRKQGNRRRASGPCVFLRHSFVFLELLFWDRMFALHLDILQEKTKGMCLKCVVTLDVSRPCSPAQRFPALDLAAVKLFSVTEERLCQAAA